MVRHAVNIVSLHRTIVKNHVVTGQIKLTVVCYRAQPKAISPTFCWMKDEDRGNPTGLYACLKYLSYPELFYVHVAAMRYWKLSERRSWTHGILCNVGTVSLQKSFQEHRYDQNSPFLYSHDRKPSSLGQNKVAAQVLFVQTVWFTIVGQLACVKP